jgi:hypothetical protein
MRIKTILTGLLLTFLPHALCAQATATPVVGWYSGDCTTPPHGGPNWYVSETDYSRTYEPFVVPSGGWTVLGVYSNDSLYLPDQGKVTQASWVVRAGVSPGNGGTVVASGIGDATSTLNSNGRYRIAVDGLQVQLTAGAYWLSVAPIAAEAQAYVCETAGVGSSGVAPGTTGAALWDSPTSKLVFAPARQHGGITGDYSLGVLTPPGPPPSPAEQWRQNIAYLTQQQLTLHLNDFPGISKSDFSANAATLSARVPSLSNLLGAKLLAVNQTSIDDVISRLNTLVPHENEWWPRQSLPGKRLTNTDFLFGTGLTPDTSGATLTVQTRSGAQASVSVQAVAASQAMMQVYQGDLPVYRQHTDRNYWATAVDGGATLYFQYNSCNEDPKQPSADFFPQLNTLLGQEGIERIVVDLRNNTGGFVSILNSWIDLIKASPFNRPGRLYVITGRATFSAAMAATDRFHDETAAIFVGEPTGGTPRFQVRIGDFALPYYGLRVSYSNGTYPANDPDHTQVPNIQTGLTFYDYMNGVDPALDAILRIPPPRF